MPIDVASGSVHFQNQDIDIPGRFKLSWDRSYNSALTNDTDSPFGLGWTCPYFAKLTRMGKDYHFLDSTGSIIKFPDPDDSVERQGTIRDLARFHEISKNGFNLRVTQWSVDGAVTRYYFQPDRNGQWWPMKSMEDASGAGLDLAWDDQGRLKGIRQKLEKRTLAVAYSSAGRIASVAFRYPDGRKQILARYDYDSKGQLASAQDALGFSERYEYGPTGKVGRVVAKDGGILSFKYDDQGRCIRSGGLDNYDLKILRYMPHLQQTEVKNSLGKSHHYQWLASGQVFLHIDPMGGKTETEYDEYGRVLAKTRPMGEKIAYEYDAEGNRSKLIDALGNESVFEYNSHHLAVKFIGADGHGWEKSYDDANRPVSAKDALGNEYGIEYDRQGNPVLLKKPDGSQSKRTYSDSGTLVSSTDWEGRSTEFVWDELGRMIKRRDPLGKTTTRQYDLLGRITQAAYDFGKTVKYQYDAGGNVTLITSTAENPVAFKYGTCRRLLEKKYGAGQTRRYTWGSEPERLETVVNEIGETYAFQYDPCDRVIAETGFDGRKTSFKYSLSGGCIARTNSLGQTISRELDALGRLVGESVPEEEPTTFQYDKSGHLLSAANAWSKISFKRDAAGRVIEEDQGGFGIKREFGPLGTVLHLESDAGIHFDYTYDHNDLVKSIDANGMGAFTYTRNEDDQVASVTLPGDSRLDSAYDSRGRLLKQSVLATGPGTGLQDPIVQREHAYDDSSMLLAMVDGHWGKSRYSHDEAKRLIQFVSDGTRTDYTLNPVGDPIAILQNGSEEIRLDYGPGGTLARKGSIEYAFDGSGRLVSKFDQKETDPSRKWIYSWNAKDQLRVVTTPNGESWEYAYDPFGRRCLKKGPGSEVRFIWDKDDLLHEIEAGKETKTWGFDPNGFKPLFKIQGKSLYSIILDYLGTPREMLDVDSRIVWSAHFDPWGNPLAGKGNLADCPFRLQGQYFDPESGLHYNRFRYYEPETGRYISRDPILLAGGISAYQYAPNPTRWCDPFGLCPEKLYRAMSQEDFEEFQRTGRMPATTETTTSPTQGFSEDYRGVLVEFELKPGTIAQLEAIGVSDGSPMVRDKYPEMPVGGKGWADEHARFKQEGTQINIALGKGDALDIFNDNITGSNVVRP